MSLSATLVTLAAAGAAAQKAGLPQLHVPDFAPQVIWLAITFGVLYLLMSRVALPRVGEVIEERRQRIQRDLDEAERLKSETEKAIAAYEQALADARTNASAIAKEQRDRLAAETERDRAEVERRIAAEIAAAEASIAATKAKALGEVDAIAAETAAAIVEKLIGNRVAPDEIKRALKTAAE